ncbi:Beta-lactamase family protein [Elusimicrobium minutum Pei191]|uniref:Beta-lactamase family protein n=1 Tax=Elusimicrobium minutum (strain Pei191) TaxID=445932 RepID=B2KBA7_ELUMP|nr:MBL fold metallo-hydrolase [Elusimicrobium minutum]ACC97929.1 Beta-lactamase family protein [Elusimicrobium minutum Pei191]
MEVKTLVLGPMGNCTYIVRQKSEAVVIDPSWDMNEIEKNLNGLKVAAVFFTHGHFDHVKDVEPFLRKLSVKAFIEENDVVLSGLPRDILQPFEGDSKIKAGGFDMEILHTPGHSEGSVCIKIGNNLFTGDTLFPGACGRVDLPHSNPRKMRHSLYRLSSLQEDTNVYSGHGYGDNGEADTTIGKEKESNIYMRNAVKDYKKGA